MPNTQSPARPAPKGAPRPGKSPSPAKRRKKGRSGNLLPLCVLGVAAVALAFVVQFNLFPNGLLPAAEEQKDRTVAAVSPITSIRISEVMSSNKGALVDGNGDSPDWIELTNTGDSPVNLQGWSLMDDPGKLDPFTFPDFTLEPGQYVVIYASGNLQTSGDFHTPFRLSASGDRVLLFDSEGRAVETINLPALDTNQVYMRVADSGEWAISTMYTPGMANTEENYRALTDTTPVSDSSLVINEVMADNASYLPDANGAYHDWIELYNSGDSDIDLTGYMLSDDSTAPDKWIFPKTTLPAGEYLIVYASGSENSATADSGLHASFKISAEHEDVLLSTPQGRIVSQVTIDNLGTDRSWARQADGSYASTVSPTPGMANTQESAAAMEQQLASSNTTGLYISEVMSSTTRKNFDQESFDWVELYNGSTQLIELSGYGLSDDPGRARKWQFPAGASIAPGERLVVYLSGNNKSSTEKASYQTNFKLSIEKDEILTLSDPSGKILDRMPLGNQYAEVSYGRVEGKSGFFYLSSSTPGEANPAQGYSEKLGKVGFSRPGGIQSESFTLELSAPEGARIYYTTDCSEPTENSTLYEGPVTVSSTVIVRARAYSDDALPSQITTASYFFGIDHTLPVVSLVTDPKNLWDEERGMYVKGPNATKEFPYGSINKGANFWMTWERAGNIEVWDEQGGQLLSQGIGVSLHGQYSRAADQKSFCITARAKYDENSRMNAKLFPNRENTEFQSIVLRSTGQDNNRARMRDAVLTSLAENTSVMYQDTQPVIVYLNGEYWGHYNMRERVNKFSIAQRMGWEEPDDLDLIKANTRALQGSADDYAALIEWLKENGCTTEENLQYVADRVDIDNYLEYEMLEIFVGNTDAGNIKKYRNAVSGDGKWRWVLFDLDWAFTTLDTNSMRRFLDPEGVGVNKNTDTTLFVQLMKNKTIEDRFLTKFGQMLATDFSTESVLEKIDAMYETLKPEMEKHYEKWEGSVSQWKKQVETLREYARKRPKVIIDYTVKTLKLSDEEKERYFGEALQKIREYNAKSESEG